MTTHFPRRLALMLLCLIAGPLHASEYSNEVITHAQALIASALAADEGSGIQVAVMRKGELAFSYAVGHADLEQNIVLKTDSRMRIGSLSKLFTYAMVARLIRDERMDADTDVREYVPEFPDKGHKVTLRQIASHTSGIRHYDFQNMSEANNTHYYDSLVDALQVFVDDPLLSAPGTAHHYSSLAVNLLGVAAEREVGEPFGRALAKEVLLPLNLDNTMPDHPLQIVPGRTRFYTVFNKQLINTFWRDSSDYYPSGGMLSTAEDLARLTHKAFDNDFLSGEAQHLIRTEAELRDGSPVGYTFGWQVARLPTGKLMYHHGGETNGAYGHVVYFPAEDLVVTGLTNYNVFPDQSNVAFFELVREQLPELFR